jgi:hypothetical protein
VEGVAAEVVKDVARVSLVMEEFVVFDVRIRRHFEQLLLPLKTLVLVFPCLTEHGYESITSERTKPLPPAGRPQDLRTMPIPTNGPPDCFRRSSSVRHGCPAQQTATNAQYEFALYYDGIDNCSAVVFSPSTAQTSGQMTALLMAVHRE